MTSSELVDRDETSSTSSALPPPSSLQAPPTYAPSQPQIMVAPLPDSASFFWGRTIQGEVFVKGLGERQGGTLNRGVKSLSVQLSLTDELPGHPPQHIGTFPVQTLWPSPPNPYAQSTSSPIVVETPFPSIHRFSFALPSSQDLPGTLNLTTSHQGQVRYQITVLLTMSSGTSMTDTIRIEGTPPDLDLGEGSSGAGSVQDDGEPKEAEDSLIRDGVRTRLLLDTARPRLGSLLRLGVEIRPMERQRTPVAGLSTQPNPSQTLRPLRRVRVEVFRRVTITTDAKISNSSFEDEGSTSSQAKATAPTSRKQHLSLIYTSGKSLRYPGNTTTHPPLRVLFTIPTAQTNGGSDQSWGEITQRTPYHSVSFFVRVTIGFGGTLELNPSVRPSSQDGQKDWFLEKEIEIRRNLWKEPSAVVIEGGEMPVLGEGDVPSLQGSMSEDQLRAEAYRLKGRDVVGSSGTFRPSSIPRRPDANGGSDAPPAFDLPHEDNDAGPSGSASRAEVDEAGLPTFLESEAQMRSGEAPLPPAAVPSRRLVPVDFENEDGFDRATMVGRRGSLGGELGTWVEYDGYETFSVAPPPMSASHGVGGIMDPPQDGDEDVNVVGGMMGRLGIEGGQGVNPSGRELMESLGLGEGTRVVDLQDDLPPGIDEPSLPALPDFSAHQPRRMSSYPAVPHSPTAHIHRRASNPPPAADQVAGMANQPPPPSFAASEAAVATQRRASQSVVLERHHGQATRGGGGQGDAPPGYPGSTAAPSTEGGRPPAYS